MWKRAKGLLRRLLVAYHAQRTENEVDMMFYAVTINYQKADVTLKDLFSGMLCKEQVKWQSLLLLFATYNVFSIPFQIALEGEWPTGGIVHFLEVFERIGDVLFIAEVFFNFYLPFEEEGVQINVHEVIQKRYVRGWMTLDIIGALPLEFPALLAGWGNKDGRHLLRLNKLVRFFRLNFYWGRLEKNLLEVHPSLIRLGKFIFSFVLCAHWVACIWLITIRAEGYERAQKFVGLDNFDTDVWDPFNRYLQGMNWAFSTMVGYGGSIPQTFPESILSVGVVLVGVVMYVVVIGTVGTIVLNLEMAENHHRQRIESMNAFFRLKKLPRNVVEKVQNYQDFLWRSRQGICAEKTVGALPHYLRAEMCLHTSLQVASKVKIFDGLCDHFYRQLVVCMHPVVVLPDTRIVVQGEVGKDMWFILRGKVEVLVAPEPAEDGDTAEESPCSPLGATSNDSLLHQASMEHQPQPHPKELSMAVLKEGHHFGELALLLTSRRTFTARTTEYCDLLRLDAEDFRVCLPCPTSPRCPTRACHTHRPATTQQVLAENYEVACQVQQNAIEKYVRVSWPPFLAPLGKHIASLFFLCVIFLSRRRCVPRLAAHLHSRRYPEALHKELLTAFGVIEDSDYAEEFEEDEEFEEYSHDESYVPLYPCRAECERKQ